jgi:nitrite reductase (NADH) small subunit
MNDAALLANQWVRITQIENIPLREGRAVQIAGRDIAIFNLGDRVLAVENKCPHRGGPLADGIVAGSSVVCPLHAWKIDLASGEVLNQPANASCARTYATRVENGLVMVEMPVASATAVPADCSAWLSQFPCLDGNAAREV